MSTKTQTALQRYTRAIDERDEHIANNKEVFKSHEAIVNRIIDAENDLRDCAAEDFAAGDKEMADNGLFRVLVVPQTQTWGDIEEIDRCVANGLITAETRAAIVKTQARPPRITISRRNT